MSVHSLTLDFKIYLLAKPVYKNYHSGSDYLNQGDGRLLIQFLDALDLRVLLQSKPQYSPQI